jgi:hypothetical protein
MPHHFWWSGRNGIKEEKARNKILIMNCPVCKKEMILQNEDFSHRSDKKQYKRRIYWCGDDDVWVNIEVPVNYNLA